MRTALLTLPAVFCMFGAADARADPFLVRYDANQFPEQVGWQRFGNDPHGLLVRTIDNGIFTIDSRASFEITDWYFQHLDALALEPSEELRLEWRMRTVETDSFWQRTDVNLTISNLGQQFVKMYLAPDYVAVNEDGVEWPEHVYWFEAEGWHTFLFTSVDMEEYDLSVDGTHAFHGRFTRYLMAGPNRVAFGDTFYGLTSLSEWDYLQVEVIPEPACGILAVVSAAVFVTAAIRRIR